MGSKSFRFIQSDGSRPSMTVGGDIKAYQSCLIRFKDAWKLHRDEQGQIHRRSGKMARNCTRS